MLIGEFRCCIMLLRYSAKVLPIEEKPLIWTLQREVLLSILNPINTSQLHLLEIVDKSKFVERFLELSLFYGLSSPLNSEMICIFPYF